MWRRGRTLRRLPCFRAGGSKLVNGRWSIDCIGRKQFTELLPCGKWSRSCTRSYWITWILSYLGDGLWLYQRFRNCAFLSWMVWDLYWEALGNGFPLSSSVSNLIRVGVCRTAMHSTFNSLRILEELKIIIIYMLLRGETEAAAWYWGVSELLCLSFTFCPNIWNEIKNKQIIPRINERVFFGVSRIFIMNQGIK